MYVARPAAPFVLGLAPCRRSLLSAQLHACCGSHTTPHADEHAHAHTCTCTHAHARTCTGLPLMLVPLPATHHMHAQLMQLEGEVVNFAVGDSGTLLMQRHPHNRSEWDITWACC
jgi:hypothetical protein